MGYIVPTDAPNPARDERGFQQKAIPMQMFDTWAKMITSRHVLFMFDSCFSGSVFAMSRAAPGIIDYKISQPVRQFIAAGAADETVPDKSIFRRQLEAALRGREADLNRDGYVSGSELGDFLQTTVVNYSYNSQHPQYGKIRDADLDKGDFVFEVDREMAAAQSTRPVVPAPDTPARPVAAAPSSALPPAQPVASAPDTPALPVAAAPLSALPPVRPVAAAQDAPYRPQMFTVNVTYMTQGGAKKTDSTSVSAYSAGEAEREAEAQFKKNNSRSTFIRAEVVVNAMQKGTGASSARPAAAAQNNSATRPPRQEAARPSSFTVKVTYMTQGGAKKTDSIAVTASGAGEAEREAEAQFKKNNPRSTFIRAEAVLNSTQK
jgi:hypothetical protein